MALFSTALPCEENISFWSSTTPNHFTCVCGWRISSPNVRVGKSVGRGRWVRSTHCLFFWSKAAPCRAPHSSSLFAKIWSCLHTEFRFLSAVMNAISSVKPRDDVSTISAACVSHNTLYKIYRITKSGDPWGRPMVSGLGLDSKSPRAIVVEHSDR